jgi:hypothetical protein
MGQGVVGTMAELSRQIFLIHSTIGADVCLQRAGVRCQTGQCPAPLVLKCTQRRKSISSCLSTYSSLKMPKLKERDNKIIQDNGRCRCTTRRQSWKPIKVAAQFFELIGVMPRSSRGGAIQRLTHLPSAGGPDRHVARCDQRELSRPLEAEKRTQSLH